MAICLLCFSLGVPRWRSTIASASIFNQRIWPRRCGLLSEFGLAERDESSYGCRVEMDEPFGAAHLSTSLSGVVYFVTVT